MAEKVSVQYLSLLKSFSRAKLADIAYDTLNILKQGFYNVHEDSQKINIRNEIDYSIRNCIVYAESDLDNGKTLICTDSTVPLSNPIIEIMECTTLQAAELLVNQDAEKNIGILNFASARNPGGGFLKGSSAQEESIARSSSLYFTLTEPRIFHEFYDYNRRSRSGLYSHRIIYSPKITIFKNDNGDLLNAPYNIGIVTVPAPNASIVHNNELIYNTMWERIRCLLSVFQRHQHDCLVLGAFGCGVFRNDPFQVANIFRQHLESKQFKGSFKRIVFAIANSDMAQIFQRVFNEDFQPNEQNQQLVLRSNRTDQKDKRHKKTKHFRGAHDKKYNNSYFDTNRAEE